MRFTLNPIALEIVAAQAVFYFPGVGGGAATLGTYNLRDNDQQSGVLVVNGDFLNRIDGTVVGAASNNATAVTVQNGGDFINNSVLNLGTTGSNLTNGVAGIRLDANAAGQQQRQY